MSGASWWSLTTVTGGRWYLPVGEGESLRQLLATRAEKDSDQQMMFAEVEDVSGSPVVLRIDNIVDLWLSTPAIRASEDDPDGMLEEIRNRSQAISQKKWDEL